MKIVYLSLTGNIRKFVEDNLPDYDTLEITHSDYLASVKEDFILIIPSYDDRITELVCEFIEFENNKKYLKAVVGSGNKNFDEDYCFSAVDVSNKYNVPLIFKFEFSGNHLDGINFKKEVQQLEVSRTE